MYGDCAYEREEALPVSQICSRTTVSVSLSTTRLVMKLAPTVEVVCEGVKAPLQYRITSEVLPTPCEPRTTILASSADDMAAGWPAVEQAARRAGTVGGWRMAKAGGKEVVLT